MHADFSVTPICACTRVPPWASINRGRIKEDWKGRKGNGQGERWGNKGTEERGYGEERMRRKKGPRKTLSHIRLPHLLFCISLYILQGKHSHESEGEIKRTNEKAYLHCVRAYVFVCVCWSVVVVFSDLCRLWLSSNSWVFGAVFCTERIGNLSSPQVFRKRSLTWWLHIHHLPPELTPPNNNTFYPCKWSFGWMTKTGLSEFFHSSSTHLNALQRPALIIVQTIMSVCSPCFCLYILLWSLCQVCSHTAEPLTAMHWSQIKTEGWDD